MYVRRTEENKLLVKRIEKVRACHLLLVAELLHDADVHCTKVGEGVGEGEENGGVGGRGSSSFDIAGR